MSSKFKVGDTLSLKFPDTAEQYGEAKTVNNVDWDYDKAEFKYTFEDGSSAYEDYLFLTEMQ